MYGYYGCQIEHFMKIYNPYAIEDVYNKLCDARKALITPIIPTNETFVRNWREMHMGNQNDYPMAATYLTQQGEYVRSKSEKILADLFLKYEIPYCYEPKLQLDNGKSLFPDFAVLNIRTRKTIYWEHFGLISDEKYASNALEKLHIYEANGWTLGDNLLYSLESENIPLNIKLLEQKINDYLL